MLIVYNKLVNNKNVLKGLRKDVLSFKQLKSAS